MGMELAYSMGIIVNSFDNILNPKLTLISFVDHSYFYMFSYKPCRNKIPTRFVADLNNICGNKIPTMLVSNSS